MTLTRRVFILLAMLKDGHIRILPVNVANKIAAGEVVERPASVVKELMENAIDAGATRIDVTVTAGGRKLIEVCDNGCGMNRDDALLCIERQATSKIRDVNDIEHIDTLGFRGEAVPSIASVSRFTLKTRREGSEAGTELSIVGGSLVDVRDAGIPVGTTVDVRDLFFNVPARRKFLRAYQTEQAHIRSVFTLHALAHPEIGMRLMADGHELSCLPSEAALEERIRDLFGAEFCSGLRKIAWQKGGACVYGFAVLPNMTRNDRSEQYIFVNRRPATAPVIAYALREAYPPLAGDRKPIILLFIELPAEDVDVNVHPTKREVRFHKTADVREAIIGAVGEAIGYKRGSLEETSATAMNPPAASSLAMSDRTEREIVSLPQTETPIPLRTRGPECAAAIPSASAGFPYPAPPPLHAANGPSAPPSAPTGGGLPLFSTSEEGAPWRWCRLLGQVAGGYLLLETEGGYVTLDPRAARERVLYERLMENHETGEPRSQALLLPETVQLAPSDAARLRKYLSIVQGLGFGVEDFGSDHFLVDSLPDVLPDVPCRELLANIAHDLENAGTRRGSEKWREELIVQAACRAVSGGESALSKEAAEKLVADLARTRMPYTCPRGRPTMIFTSYRELERKFGR